MPLDTMEGIAAMLREGPIFAAVKTTLDGMPAVTPERPRKAVDWAPMFGAKPGTPIYETLAEVNDPVHEFGDAVRILQLDPSSPFGMQAAALDLLIKDIKD